LTPRNVSAVKYAKKCAPPTALMANWNNRTKLIQRNVSDAGRASRSASLKRYGNINLEFRV